MLLRETTATQKKSFAAAAKAQAKSMDRLDREAIKEMLKLLRTARKNIVARIAATDSEFLVEQLDAMKSEVTRAMREFENAWKLKYEEISFRAEDLGSSMVSAPLEKVGITLRAPSISASKFRALSNFHADKITGLTNATIDQITSKLSLGVLGGSSKDKLLKDIAKLLPGPGRAGTVAGRASTIVRTEVNRIHATATQLRMEDAVDQVPDLRKAWLPEIDNRTRETHVQAGQDFSEENAIPVDKPFTVGGHKAMFPRDPALLPFFVAVAFRATVRIAVMPSRIIMVRERVLSEANLKSSPCRTAETTKEQIPKSRMHHVKRRWPPRVHSNWP